MSARFLVQWLLLVLLTAVAFFQVIHFYYAVFWKSSRQKAMIMRAKKQTHFPTCNVPSKETHQVTPHKSTKYFQTNITLSNRLAFLESLSGICRVSIIREKYVIVLVLRWHTVYSMVDQPSYALKLCPTRKKWLFFLIFFFFEFFLLHAKNWKDFIYLLVEFLFKLFEMCPTRKKNWNQVLFSIFFRSLKRQGNPRPDSSIIQNILSVVSWTIAILSSSL